MKQPLYQPEVSRRLHFLLELIKTTRMNPYDENSTPKRCHQKKSKTGKPRETTKSSVVSNTSLERSEREEKLKLFSSHSSLSKMSKRIGLSDSKMKSILSPRLKSLERLSLPMSANCLQDLKGETTDRSDENKKAVQRLKDEILMNKIQSVEENLRKIEMLKDEISSFRSFLKKNSGSAGKEGDILRGATNKNRERLVLRIPEDKRLRRSHKSSSRERAAKKTPETGTPETGTPKKDERSQSLQHSPKTSAGKKTIKLVTASKSSLSSRKSKKRRFTKKAPHRETPLQRKIKQRKLTGFVFDSETTESTDTISPTDDVPMPTTTTTKVELNILHRHHREPTKEENDDTKMKCCKGPTISCVFGKAIADTLELDKVLSGVEEETVEKIIEENFEDEIPILVIPPIIVEDKSSLMAHSPPQSQLLSETHMKDSSTNDIVEDISHNINDIKENRKQMRQKNFQIQKEMILKEMSKCPICMEQKIKRKKLNDIKAALVNHICPDYNRRCSTCADVLRVNEQIRNATNIYCPAHRQFLTLVEKDSATVDEEGLTQMDLVWSLRQEMENQLKRIQHLERQMLEMKHDDVLKKNAQRELVDAKISYNEMLFKQQVEALLIQQREFVARQMENHRCLGSFCELCTVKSDIEAKLSELRKGMSSKLRAPPRKNLSVQQMPSISIPGKLNTQRGIQIDISPGEAAGKLEVSPQGYAAMAKQDNMIADIESLIVKHNLDKKAFDKSASYINCHALPLDKILTCKRSKQMYKLARKLSNEMSFIPGILGDKMKEKYDVYKSYQVVEDDAQQMEMFSISHDISGYTSMSSLLYKTYINPQGRKITDKDSKHIPYIRKSISGLSASRSADIPDMLFYTELETKLEEVRQKVRDLECGHDISSSLPKLSFDPYLNMGKSNKTPSELGFTATKGTQCSSYSLLRWASREPNHEVTDASIQISLSSLSSLSSSVSSLDSPHKPTDLETAKPPELKKPSELKIAKPTEPKIMPQVQESEIASVQAPKSKYHKKSAAKSLRKSLSKQQQVKTARKESVVTYADREQIREIPYLDDSASRQTELTYASVLPEPERTRAPVKSAEKPIGNEYYDSIAKRASPAQENVSDMAEHFSQNSLSESYYKGLMFDDSITRLISKRSQLIFDQLLKQNKTDDADVTPKSSSKEKKNFKKTSPTPTVNSQGKSSKTSSLKSNNGKTVKPPNYIAMPLQIDDNLVSKTFESYSSNFDSFSEIGDNSKKNHHDAETQTKRAAEGDDLSCHSKVKKLHKSQMTDVGKFLAKSPQCQILKNETERSQTEAEKLWIDCQTETKHCQNDADKAERRQSEAKKRRSEAKSCQAETGQFRNEVERCQDKAADSWLEAEERCSEAEERCSEAENRRTEAENCLMEARQQHHKFERCEAKAEELWPEAEELSPEVEKLWLEAKNHYNEAETYRIQTQKLKSKDQTGREKSRIDAYKSRIECHTEVEMYRTEAEKLRTEAENAGQDEAERLPTELEACRIESEKSMNDDQIDVERSHLNASWGRNLCTEAKCLTKKCRMKAENCRNDQIDQKRLHLNLYNPPEVEKCRMEAEKCLSETENCQTETNRHQNEAKKLRANDLTGAKRSQKTNMYKTQIEIEKLQIELDKMRSDAHKYQTQVENCQGETEKSLAHDLIDAKTTQNSKIYRTQIEIETLKMELHKIRSDALKSRIQAENCLTETENYRFKAENLLGNNQIDAIRSQLNLYMCRTEVENSSNKAEKSRTEGEKSESDHRIDSKRSQLDIYHSKIKTENKKYRGEMEQNWDKSAMHRGEAEQCQTDTEKCRTGVDNCRAKQCRANAEKCRAAAEQCRTDRGGKCRAVAEKCRVKAEQYQNECIKCRAGVEKCRNEAEKRRIETEQRRTETNKRWTEAEKWQSDTEKRRIETERQAKTNNPKKTENEESLEKSYHANRKETENGKPSEKSYKGNRKGIENNYTGTLLEKTCTDNQIYSKFQRPATNDHIKINKPENSSADAESITTEIKSDLPETEATRKTPDTTTETFLQKPEHNIDKCMLRIDTVNEPKCLKEILEGSKNFEDFKKDLESPKSDSEGAGKVPKGAKSDLKGAEKNLEGTEHLESAENLKCAEKRFKCLENFRSRFESSDSDSASAGEIFKRSRMLHSKKGTNNGSTEIHYKTNVKDYPGSEKSRTDSQSTSKWSKNYQFFMEHHEEIDSFCKEIGYSDLSQKSTHRSSKLLKNEQQRVCDNNKMEEEDSQGEHPHQRQYKNENTPTQINKEKSGDCLKNSKDNQDGESSYRSKFIVEHCICNQTFRVNPKLLCECKSKDNKSSPKRNIFTSLISPRRRNAHRTVKSNSKKTEIVRDDSRYNKLEMFYRETNDTLKKLERAHKGRENCRTYTESGRKEKHRTCKESCRTDAENFHTGWPTEAESWRTKIERCHTEAERSRTEGERFCTDAKNGHTEAKTLRPKTESCRTKPENNRTCAESCRKDTKTDRACAESCCIDAMRFCTCTESCRKDTENIRTYTESCPSGAENRHICPESCCREPKNRHRCTESSRKRAKNYRTCIANCRKQPGNCCTCVESYRNAIKNYDTCTVIYRKDAENYGTNAENDSKDTKRHRKYTESCGKDAENSRTNAENARIDAESCRTCTESCGKGAETSCTCRESCRKDTENNPTGVENVRKDAKSSRKPAENYRTTTENDRKGKEIYRTCKESCREGKERFCTCTEGFLKDTENYLTKAEHAGEGVESCKEAENYRRNTENVAKHHLVDIKSCRKDAEYYRTITEDARKDEESCCKVPDNYRMSTGNARKSTEHHRTCADSCCKGAENVCTCTESDRKHGCMSKQKREQDESSFGFLNSAQTEKANPESDKIGQEKSSGHTCIFNECLQGKEGEISAQTKQVDNFADLVVNQNKNVTYDDESRQNADGKPTLSEQQTLDEAATTGIFTKTKKSIRKTDIKFPPCTKKGDDTQKLMGDLDGPASEKTQFRITEIDDMEKLANGTPTRSEEDNVLEFGSFECSKLCSLEHSKLPAEGETGNLANVLEIYESFKKKEEESGTKLEEREKTQTIFQYDGCNTACKSKNTEANNSKKLKYYDKDAETSPNCQTSTQASDIPKKSLSVVPICSPTALTKDATKSSDVSYFVPNQDEVNNCFPSSRKVISEKSLVTVSLSSMSSSGRSPKSQHHKSDAKSKAISGERPSTACKKTSQPTLPSNNFQQNTSELNLEPDKFYGVTKPQFSKEDIKVLNQFLTDKVEHKELLKSTFDTTSSQSRNTRREKTYKCHCRYRKILPKRCKSKRDTSLDREIFEDYLQVCKNGRYKDEQSNFLQVLSDKSHRDFDGKLGRAQSPRRPHNYPGIVSECSESVSEGEVVLNEKLKNEKPHIRDVVEYYKQHPNKLFEETCSKRNPLSVMRERMYYKNWVAYYLDKSGSDEIINNFSSGS